MRNSKSITSEASDKATSVLNKAVVIGALGYFVDIFDLLLFGIVRVPSLKAIGVPQESLLDTGAFLINMQMSGLLIGGVLWGVIGDKRGRVSVLFGSILLYSLANIANAFVTTVEVYGALRFIAGVGLAGELGAAITLVSETMSKELRGYGTAIVAGVGILGAVAAALIGEMFSWQIAYLTGGGLGLVLLAARFSMLESGLYESLKQAGARRGDFLKIFTSRERLFKYLACVAVGVPIWYTVGILVTFAPEFGKAFGATETLLASKAIMYCYIGLSAGDLASGFLSQHLKSRKKAVWIFLSITMVGAATYLFSSGGTATYYYAVSVLLGVGAGYWAVFITTAAEQFGTNLRATATTSIPNFVRGAVVPMTLAFQALREPLGLIYSAFVVGAIAMLLALVALVALAESYGEDLNYLEQI